MRISLLHATYRAGNAAVGLRGRWLDESTGIHVIEHLFACDADDEVSMGCPAIAAGVVGPPVLRVSAVRNWNAAAAVATGDLLFVIADDLWPPHHWDGDLASALGDLDPTRVPFVIKVGDSDDDDNGHIRHPVVSRRYFERFGLWRPEYDGHWVDHDFTISAYLNGLVLDGRRIKFYHAHPTSGAEHTESHLRIRSESAVQGRQLFETRYPAWRRQVLRRYYRPKPGTVVVSERLRRSRGLLARVGHLKSVVPLRTRRTLRVSLHGSARSK